VPPRDPAWAVFRTELRAHLTGRMTSAALAGKLGVDEETVSNWRKGRTHPRLGQLPRIAETLHMGVTLPQMALTRSTCTARWECSPPGRATKS
jgi:transcriptional regulator with XRE-family HTH domain